MQSVQDHDINMTREMFIESLLKTFGVESWNALAYGMEHGWLEYEDELCKNDPVTRKHIARILHMFLLKEKGICDLPDIGGAGVLRDLYDCRVCANHVAQIYLRGIMDAKDLASDGGFLWFDLDGEDSQENIHEYIRRTVETVNNEGKVATL